VNPLAAMPLLRALAAPWNEDNDQYNIFDHGGGWDEDKEDGAGGAAEDEAEDSNDTAQDNADVYTSAPGGSIYVKKHTINIQEVTVETSQLGTFFPGWHAVYVRWTLLS